MECSTNARLLFIGMWNFADDLGRLALSPKSIKAQVFPSDNFSSDEIVGMLVELSKNDLVLGYVVDEKEYLLITGWHHQRIDKPQKPKCPAPPEHSRTIPRTFAPYLTVSNRIGEEEPSQGKTLSVVDIGGRR